jgi:peptidoglycan LD-endopeptidase CwlK
VPDNKLEGVHPELVFRVNKILKAMDALGHPMKVISGVRTTAEQQKLFTQVPKVTNCDGIVKKSNHQAKLDGFGHAVDICFQGTDPFGENQPWAIYGAIAKFLGLKWGGDFTTIKDRPHIELP